MAVAIVTGASSGIGEAIARAMAASGFAVALGARRVERLEALAAEIRGSGAQGQAFALDLCDGDSIDAFFHSVESEMGAAEVLVNNAGLCRPGLFEDGTSEDLEVEVATNLLGPARLTRHMVRSLRASASPGDIVFISSENAVVPRTYQAGYTLTKMGIEGLAAVLRMELEGAGFRSTVVRPGPTHSEFGYEWPAPLLQRILASWKYWGVQRSLEMMPAESVAMAVRAVVEAPRGTHFDLLEVMPEGVAPS